MMVFQSERVPLSRVLPQLYLGAESDITQDCLSARGISYVVSVSRCCPQPSFLPQSRYLRIPIDDSLRDDLLPWIPEALRFIDGALSLGCSVIVHCAAGISRSPALAVAYVMYSLEMDLDHAYRFVKERRPTISPNFNFLGQLQLFQHTLPLKSADSHSHSQQPITSPSTCAQTANSSSTTGEEARRSDVTPEFTLSLSDRLRTLSLSTERVDPQRPEAPSRTRAPAPQKPTHLHIPSLSEKRKSLSLSLTPLGTDAHERARQQRETELACSFPAVLEGATGDLEKDGDGERPASGGTSAACSRTQKRRRQEKSDSPAAHRVKEAQRGKTGQQRRERGRKTRASHQQEATGTDRWAGAMEAVEVTDGDQSPVSPLHLTINRLLGLLITPHIKVGHAALPYRC